MSKYAKFDRDEVIEKATNLYWEKGFHGTSMRNLQDVVDLRPGSIYASFGSKENLFKEALQHYANEGNTLLQRYLDEEPSPLNALQKFVTHVVIDLQNGTPSGMCMLVKTIGELTNEHEELLTLAKSKLLDLESKIASIIELSIASGELSSHLNASKIARRIQVQIIGIRTYIRANKELELGRDMVEELFDSIRCCKPS